MPGDIVTEQNRTYFVNGQAVARCSRFEPLSGRTLALPGPTGAFGAAISSQANTRTRSTAATQQSVGFAAHLILGVGRPIP